MSFGMSASDSAYYVVMVAGIIAAFLIVALFLSVAIAFFEDHYRR
jgi:hypothetical protein